MHAMHISLSSSWPWGISVSITALRIAEPLALEGFGIFAGIIRGSERLQFLYGVILRKFLGPVDEENVRQLVITQMMGLCRTSH